MTLRSSPAREERCMIVSHHTVQALARPASNPMAWPLSRATFPICAYSRPTIPNYETLKVHFL
jgi:hypothetical protein